MTPYIRATITATAALIASFSIVQSGAAQSVLTHASISIEAAWSGGYMGLGGGLLKAIDDATETSSHKAPKVDVETEKTRSATEPAHKRVRHKRAASAVAAPRPRRVQDRAPVTLISETLDHTGLNISTITAHQAAR